MKRSQYYWLVTQGFVLYYFVPKVSLAIHERAEMMDNVHIRARCPGFFMVTIFLYLACICLLFQVKKFLFCVAWSVVEVKTNIEEFGVIKGTEQFR